MNSVGLISSIRALCLRAFFAAWRSLLLLRTLATAGLALRLDLSEGLLLVAREDELLLVSSVISPSATDSGTIRRDVGSTRLDVAAGAVRG